MLDGVRAGLGGGYLDIEASVFGETGLGGKLAYQFPSTAYLT
jgi:hypothetical protein